jgi:hypothetical protein
LFGVISQNFIFELLYFSNSHPNEFLFYFFVILFKNTLPAKSHANTLLVQRDHLLYEMLPAGKSTK